MNWDFAFYSAQKEESILTTFVTRATSLFDLPDSVVCQSTNLSFYDFEYKLHTHFNVRFCFTSKILLEGL